jgi:hypothetical protein
MGTLKTILVNETDKTLHIEEYCMQVLIQRWILLPKLNATAGTTERNPQLKSMRVLHSNPNDTFRTFCVFHDWRDVLNFSSDHFIDNAVITIRWDTEKEMFLKHYEQRYVILKIAEH